ncbi:hypothetical protein D9M71_239730 [compost metagenome]
MQGGEDRHGEQGAQDAEGDQDRASTDLVGQATDHRLQAHEQEQRGGRDGGRVTDAHAHGVDQVLLHVGGVGVEGQGAAHGQANHGQQFLGMTHQCAHQALFWLFLLLGEGFGFFHATTQVKRDHGTQGADDERNTPAPRIQLFGGQGLLQDDQHTQGDELAGDQGHVLEAGEETAAFLGCHLAQVSGRGTVLTANRQALKQTRHDQQDRCGDTDGFVAGSQGNDQRAEAHHQHRYHQCRLAALAVGIQAHEPATDRAHQKANGEDRGSIEQLRSCVARRKEGFGEIQGKCCVDVPVVPFDHVADRTAEDRFEATSGGAFSGRGSYRPSGQGSGIIH